MGLKEMVERLQRAGYIRSEKVERAMLSVDRALFVPERYRGYAYHDTPLEIGHGQTISAPHMVAIMCELLELGPGMEVLEIGAGSGYHSAVIGEIIGEEGRVCAVERIPDLAQMAKENLEKAGIKNVDVVVGDGSLGLEDKKPFDRILVTCGAPSIPQPLMDQLVDGGIMVIPVGSMHYQDLMIVKRAGKGYKTTNWGGVVFVPLIGERGFSSGEHELV
jgi:protein-L-isoaspartate(D-aspartate) O-methyltransferase